MATLESKDQLKDDMLDDVNHLNIGRARVEEFRRKHRIGLVTMLFMDLVGSTRLKSLYREVEAVGIIQAHHELVRKIGAGYPESEEISSAGDSFFFVFSKPSDAVRFAIQVHKVIREFARQVEKPVADRIAIHVGEVVITEGDPNKEKDLFGLQVDSCARILSLSKNDRILMSGFVFDTARQVLRYEDTDDHLLWVNHGPYRLKWRDDPIDICEVSFSSNGKPLPPENSDKAERCALDDAEEEVLGWRPAKGETVPGTAWVLDEMLGEGAVGEVWLAYNSELNERRVFKFCFQAEKVRSLKREVTLFKILKQQLGEIPNVLLVRDVYLEKPPYFISVYYVNGRDLLSWVKQKGGLEKIPLSDRLELVAQVASALQRAHEAGIIHRDVKPSNILIAEDPEKGPVAKLADFGVGQIICRETAAKSTRMGFTQTLFSSSSSPAGTHLYMAPELLVGKPATTKSDIYSLGVMLFQLVTGDLSRPLISDWEVEVHDPQLRDDIQACVTGDVTKRLGLAGELATRLRSLPARREAAAGLQPDKERAVRLSPAQGMNYPALARRPYWAGLFVAAGLFSFYCWGRALLLLSPGQPMWWLLLLGVVFYFGTYMPGFKGYLIDEKKVDACLILPPFSKRHACYLLVFLWYFSSRLWWGVEGSQWREVIGLLGLALSVPAFALAACILSTPVFFSDLGVGPLPWGEFTTFKWDSKKRLVTLTRKENPSTWFYKIGGRRVPAKCRVGIGQEEAALQFLSSRIPMGR